MEPKEGATVPGTYPEYSTTHPKRLLVHFWNIKLLSSDTGCTTLEFPRKYIAESGKWRKSEGIVPDESSQKDIEEPQRIWRYIRALHHGLVLKPLIDFNFEIAI